jgi:hypothetical protein
MPGPKYSARAGVRPDASTAHRGDPGGASGFAAIEMEIASGWDCCLSVTLPVDRSHLVD